MTDIYPYQVPETKGRTLEEMDELFGSGNARFAAEDLARKERIEREVGSCGMIVDKAGEDDGLDETPEVGCTMG